MTSVNLPRDDAANRIDTKSVADRSVKQVEPYPTVQPVKEHEDVTNAPTRIPQRSMQRRKQERRKKDVPVLLDTRVGHDRRNASNTANSEQEDASEENSRTGIDVYS